MNILAIDPGSELSAFLLSDGNKILEKGHIPNSSLLTRIEFESKRGYVAHLAIENIKHYGTGMPAGKDVFDTCVFIGEMRHAWGRPDAFSLIPRKTIVAHHCGSARANISHIRQALIDRLGKQGTKKSPGTTYGVATHVWDALAVAAYAYDIRRVPFLGTTSLGTVLTP